MITSKPKRRETDWGAWLCDRCKKPQVSKQPMYCLNCSEAQGGFLTHPPGNSPDWEETGQWIPVGVIYVVYEIEET